MPQSMTGFAAAEVEVGARKLVWEIRSVNHRYLDISFRLPEELRVVEPALRELASSRLKRGKVDCTLRIVAAGDKPSAGQIDVDRLDALRTLEARVRESCPGAGPLTVHEILRWPGILRDQSAFEAALDEPALECFGRAVDSLGRAREREGERIAAMLSERLDGIDELMRTIEPLLADAAPRYRDKLRERLEKLEVEAQPERLEQELALIAQRVDVSEERDRLRAHVSELRDILGRREPIGRRLDFLIQELNREANTLASKVQDDELARRAVDLKVLIEQMREQVQNVE